MWINPSDCISADSNPCATPLGSLQRQERVHSCCLCVTDKSYAPTTDGSWLMQGIPLRTRLGQRHNNGQVGSIEGFMSPTHYKTVSK